MPTYDYLCDECGFRFEEFQSIAAEPLHVCPRCGGHVHRLISGGGGIIFKGSGFYETDYKRNSFRGNSSSGQSGKTTPSEDVKKAEKSETKSS